LNLNEFIGPLKSIGRQSLIKNYREFNKGNLRNKRKKKFYSLDFGFWILEEDYVMKIVDGLNILTVIMKIL
jgi:hypothetical protein